MIWYIRDKHSEISYFHNNTLIKTGYYKFQVLSDTELVDYIYHIEKNLGIKLNTMDIIIISTDNPVDFNFKELAKKNKWLRLECLSEYSPLICTIDTDFIKTHHKKLNHHPADPHGRRVVIQLDHKLGVTDGILLPDNTFWLGETHSGQLYFPDKNISAEAVLLELGLLLNQNKTLDTLDIFSFYLGMFVGAIQLTFMPTGGLWLTGETIINNPDIFYSPAFKKGLDNIPAHLDKRRQLPLAIMKNSLQAIFNGASHYGMTKLCLC